MINKATTTGIIDPKDLHALLQNPGNISIKILDATLPPPGSSINPMHGFSEKRIPGALFFDIDGASDHGTDLPHMLPSPEVFEACMANLGITNDDLVIVYGQDGLIMGPARAWWMFRTFGHDHVLVLDGGLPAWLDSWYPVDTGLPLPAARAASGRFKAHFRPEFVVNMQQVADLLGSEETVILDARPQLRFSGEAPEPRPGLYSGHIPGSLSLPAVSLVDIDTRKLKSPDVLEEIALQMGLSKEDRFIATCGSGVTSCVISLALFTIGYGNIPVYDGSWAEWGRPESKMPVAGISGRAKTSDF